MWSAFYEQRWARPCALAAGVTWQARYGRKLRTQAAYGGRARQDNLFGHRAGVRCLGLLPGRNLLATGSGPGRGRAGSGPSSGRVWQGWQRAQQRQGLAGLAAGPCGRK